MIYLVQGDSRGRLSLSPQLREEGRFVVPDRSCGLEPGDRVVRIPGRLVVPSSSRVVGFARFRRASEEEIAAAQGASSPAPIPATGAGAPPSGALYQIPSTGAWCLQVPGCARGELLTPGDAQGRIVAFWFRAGKNLSILGAFGDEVQAIPRGGRILAQHHDHHGQVLAGFIHFPEGDITPRGIRAGGHYLIHPDGHVDATTFCRHPDLRVFRPLTGFRRDHYVVGRGDVTAADAAAAWADRYAGESLDFEEITPAPEATLRFYHPPVAIGRPVPAPDRNLARIARAFGVR